MSDALSGKSTEQETAAVAPKFELPMTELPTVEINGQLYVPLAEHKRIVGLLTGATWLVEIELKQERKRITEAYDKERAEMLADRERLTRSAKFDAVLEAHLSSNNAVLIRIATALENATAK